MTHAVLDVILRNEESGATNVNDLLRLHHGEPMVQGPLHGHHRRPCGPRETHNYKTLKSFTQKYIITNPVHVEEFDGPKSAIAREKQIKGWTRDKKVALIESMNPDWEDLSQNWFSHGVVSPPPDSSVPQYDVKDELALNATLEAAK